MPYEWIPPDATDPVERLHLWPYRSLPKRGFVWFFGGTAALLALPLLAVLGSPVLWGVLPFILAALAMLWHMVQRNYRDGELLEELCLGETEASLTRRAPRQEERRWAANPHWIEVHLHRKGGPVQNYVTLKGAGREVEIGAFLSEEERLALYDELSRKLPVRP